MKRAKSLQRLKQYKQRAYVMRWYGLHTYINSGRAFIDILTHRAEGERSCGSAVAIGLRRMSCEWAGRTTKNNAV